MKQVTKQVWVKALAWSAGIVLLSAALLFFTAATYVQALDVSKLSEPLTAPTRLLDRHGNEFYQLSVTKSEPVAFERLPQALIDAIVAVEDRRYYEHAGVDVAAIARALYRDIRAGGYAEGASTITQQLAKTAFLTPDKRLERKLREAAYALKIEMTYDKDEVLERYLNTIYFGAGAWGVQAASRIYFGKDVSELSLEEAALLAALPKAPSRYSPFDNPDGARERRDLVLGLMRDQGLIEEAAYQAAVQTEVTLREDEDSGHKAAYASYADAVIAEAIGRYGLTERQIMAGGWTIATELDPVAQEAVAEVFADDAMFPPSENGRLVQSGAAIVDHRTGGVRALMGSREHGGYRSFNRATQLKRQPGSAFKPIAVYGPALEAGVSPNDRLYDGPFDANGYRPRNWDGGYRGEVTMAEAIRQSWNVPAVWLLQQLGVDQGTAFAARLGIELPEADRNLGLALGGLSEGVSPLQLAQAFSAFASNGLLHEAHLIQRIETADGVVVGRYDEAPVQAIDPDAAYTMTLLLQHAATEGTGKQGVVPGRPTAGKTGTTELPETEAFAGIDGGAKDLWFAGYTPELTGAVWIGYDKTDRDHYLKTSSAAAASVFREMMTRALADAPSSEFVPPPGYRDDWSVEEAQPTDEADEKKGKGRKQPRDRERGGGRKDDARNERSDWDIRSFWDVWSSWNARGVSNGGGGRSDEGPEDRSTAQDASNGRDDDRDDDDRDDDDRRDKDRKGRERKKRGGADDD